MKKRIFFLSVLIFSIITSAFYSNVNISYAGDVKKNLKASSYQYYDKTSIFLFGFLFLVSAVIYLRDNIRIKHWRIINEI